MHTTPAVTQAMAWLHEAGFLSAEERQMAASLFDPRFEFAAALQLADSIHLHIRVEDTETLPREAFIRHGAMLDREQPGYLKFCFPGGLNAIFSSIAVADEDAGGPRSRPHLDHLGIDLRRENDIVQSGFNRIPGKAKSLGWGHVAQGGKDRPVLCCFIEVAAKHWVYPAAGSTRQPVPLEFSYGPLKPAGTTAGDDLRPSAATVQLAAGAKQKCCG